MDLISCFELPTAHHFNQDGYIFVEIESIFKKHLQLVLRRATRYT